MYHYLITGATGYIGSTIIKYLFSQNPLEEIKITAIVRNIQKAKAMLPSGVEFIFAELTDTRMLEQINGKYDNIIHCASITESCLMITRPVEVIESIVNSTQNILKLAGRCGASSVVYLSSMEVYGKIDCSGGMSVKEEELGNLEISNVRSCYAAAKRMAENICFCSVKEYGIPVKIARLAQTFGVGILPEESRVFAQFARAVCGQQDIVLHTRGNSMGNYCEIIDAVRAILLILKKGVDGETYNVVNEESTMTIRQMAELAANQVAEGKIRVVYDIQEGKQYGYAEDTGLRLSAGKLRNLGWKPTKNLEEMFQDAITAWKATGQTK